jgi:hypothetical protein
MFVPIRQHPFAQAAAAAGQQTVADSATDSGTGRTSSVPPPDHRSASGQDKLNSVDILTYPLNVDVDQQQGHYILFEIYEQDPAQLAANKAVASVQGQLDKASQETGTEQPIDGAGAPGDSRGVGETFKSNASKSFQKQSGPNSIQVKKDATKRMDTTIGLYMPPTVQVSYGANYGDQEIGAIAESANAAIQAFSETGGGFITRASAAAGAASGGLSTGIIGKLKQMAPTGAEAIFAINSGSVITPRMELMFEGIQRRNFSFNFDFIPRSAQEAKIIERIVKKFKYHMSSNYGRRGTNFSLGGVDGVREMTIPDFFQITYMYLGKKNPHLNLIKKCVLTNTSVEYGSDRFKAFADGQPQTTKLGLNFSELEIITKDYIDEGY